MGHRLLKLEEAISRADVGGKAEHLHWLYQQGERVPPTLVVTTSREGPLDRERLARQLAASIDADRSYAIRSSATVEDGDVHSFAGQFTTRLDVSGLDAIVDAIAEVASSAQTRHVSAYLERTALTGETIEVAVLIQEMVEPVVSGVAFSRNPITGLDEIVVEAVPGRGTALVDDGHTPHRWIHKWGDWIAAPPESDIPHRLIEEVVERTRSIASAFGRPVDLEWVYDGKTLNWVQMRAITGLEDMAIYSNRIAREVLPGLIKPLVWSVNVPMVNRAWIRLFTELVGDIGLEPDDLAKAFGYRAYFNMSAIGDIFEALGMPRDSLELLLGFPPGSEQPGFKPSLETMRHMPRILKTLAARRTIGRDVDTQLPELIGRYQEFAAIDAADLDDQALLATVEDLERLGTETAYLNIVVPLVANAYGAMLRRSLRGTHVAFTELDVAGDVPEMRGWSPNPMLDELSRQLSEHPPSTRAALTARGWNALPDDLRPLADQFVARFGHLSDSGNDFSARPWRENLDLVASLIARHEPSTASQLPWPDVEARLPRWKRPPLRRLRLRTAHFLVRREAVSSTYTFGYGLFRGFFLEAGKRLADRGCLAEPADVMYLTRDEVEDLLTAAEPADARELVASRRAEMAAASDVAPPDVIYGDEYVLAPLLSEPVDELQGVATSRGRYRGTARVITSHDQFDELQAGEVLVVPYSDVGWTPLFARAGAVVAESGGMLSHSSIVAREYRLPCVVSVTGATRIPSGSTVTVDGYTGRVSVE